MAHAVVRGSVELHHIEKAAGLDAEAALSICCRLPFPVLTVHRLGENLCAGGFARAGVPVKGRRARAVPPRPAAAKRFGDVLRPTTSEKA